MPLTKVRKSLYIPGEGEHLLEEKDVVHISRRDLVMLSWLHEWAANQQINIFCKRCERPISGANNDSTKHPSVSCQCREWRYVEG